MKRTLDRFLALLDPLEPDVEAAAEDSVRYESATPRILLFLRPFHTASSLLLVFVIAISRGISVPGPEKLR